jgi:hypothetical protein
MLKFSTPDGNIPIKSVPGLTIEELLLINRLPPISFSAFQIFEGQSLVVPVHSDDIFDLDAVDIVLKPDRNIDYSTANPKRTNPDNTSAGILEFPVRTSAANIENHSFTQNECQAYVRASVNQFFSNLPNHSQNAPIVLGYSGGGDSNALLDALLECPYVRTSQIYPVMMLGIPDWDAMQETALAEAKRRQLGLQIVPANEVADIIGIKKDKNWVSAFQQAFPGEDLELIGTYALRKVLSHAASAIKAQAVITGLNSEDLFAESLAATCQGLPSPPIPRRIISGTEFWFPLYLVPKKIGDGCAPLLSRANYDARKPSFAYGRAVYYYAAQTLGYYCPGLIQDALRGIEARHSNNSSFEYPESLGDMSSTNNEKWNALFKNYD